MSAICTNITVTSHEHHSISNHRQLSDLFYSLFRITSKEGNIIQDDSPVCSGFPLQRDSYAEGHDLIIKFSGVNHKLHYNVFVPYGTAWLIKIVMFATKFTATTPPMHNCNDNIVSKVTPMYVVWYENRTFMMTAEYDNRGGASWDIDRADIVCCYFRQHQIYFRFLSFLNTAIVWYRYFKTFPLEDKDLVSLYSQYTVMAADVLETQGTRVSSSMILTLLFGFSITRIKNLTAVVEWAECSLIIGVRLVIPSFQLDPR